MDSISSTTSARALSRILQGLDVSMGRNYIHAEVINKYFPDRELNGVYSIEIDCDDRACVEFVRERLGERHILDLACMDTEAVADLLVELMGQTSTKVIITLDGDVILGSDITPKRVAYGEKVGGLQ